MKTLLVAILFTLLFGFLGWVLLGVFVFYFWPYLLMFFVLIFCAKQFFRQVGLWLKREWEEAHRP